MMLGHTGTNGRKSSKFEDSDSRMSARPSSRAVSELPLRPAQRLKSAAGGSEAACGTPRRALGVVRGTAPRSPLHETKKPAGAGAGPRVAEVEAKLGRAHGQLMVMREQLAGAEKARKDARAVLVENKKRLAAKKKDDVVTTAPAERNGGGKEPAAADEAAAASAVPERGDEGKIHLSSPATDANEAIVPSPRESVNKVGPVVEEGNNKTSGEEETSNADAAADDGAKKNGSPEVEVLRAKLVAKDMEVYELRAKLMVIDTEVDDLRGKVMAKSTELDELKATMMSSTELADKLEANLMVKDAEIAALESDNADLTKTAEEAAEAANAAAARARETEHALRESAAREARLAERLRASEHAREELEAEAQRSRVQSEQWRKAAEEAAAVLGSGTAGSGTDKRRHRSASASGGESDCTDAKDGDEEGSGGKRKAGGAMRALSDLWKKKAQK
ncbi:hypothetical protein BS78_09G201500 [Paspalum vaginatum]|nr:hypothetical protein BS78_09G201500 [Paspalum vaginatum]